MPSSVRTSQMLSDQYDHWHSGLRDDGDEPTATAPWHVMALSRLEDVANLDVLEIACGRGAFAKELAARGANVIAADFSSEAVRRAQQLIADAGEAIVADIQAIPFPDDHFDLVVSLETLEHIPDVGAGVRELVRVLRPGGRLVVTGPNYLNLIGAYRGYLRLRGRRYAEVGQPLNRFVVLPVQVARFRRAGCRIVEIVGDGYKLPVARGSTLDLQWPRRVPGAKWLAYETMIVAVKQPRTSAVGCGSSGVSAGQR